VTDEDEWVDAEWVVRQDSETASLGALTTGLAARVSAEPLDLSREEVPLTGLDQLEQAVGDLVIAFEEGELEIEDAGDGAPDAHLSTYRVHLKLRRSEFKLVENAVGAAVSFLTPDSASGLISALNLMQTLIRAASWLSAAERDAASFVLANQRRAVITRRDELTPYGIDVDNLIRKGVFVERNEGLSVSAPS